MVQKKRKFNNIKNLIIYIIMPSKEYDHYLQLSKENLIITIEKKDNEIKEFQKSLKKMEKLKHQYYVYNKFHMEEIVRLDKKIGVLKGLREQKYFYLRMLDESNL